MLCRSSPFSSVALLRTHYFTLPCFALSPRVLSTPILAAATPLVYNPISAVSTEIVSHLRRCPDGRFQAVPCRSSAPFFDSMRFNAISARVVSWCLDAMPCHAMSIRIAAVSSVASPCPCGASLVHALPFRFCSCRFAGAPCPFVSSPCHSVSCLLSYLRCRAVSVRCASAHVKAISVRNLAPPLAALPFLLIFELFAAGQCGSVSHHRRSMQRCANLIHCDFSPFRANRSISFASPNDAVLSYAAPLPRSDCLV